MKKTFVEFLASKSITQEKFDGFDGEEKAGLYSEYNTELKNYIETLEKNVDGKANKEELTSALNELRENQLTQAKELNKTIEAMGLKIVALSEGESSKKEKLESLGTALKRIKEDGTIGKIIEGSSSGMVSVTKAAATMLESTNISGGNVPVEQRIAGLNTVASRRVRLLDILAKGLASSNIISWVYQANKDGAAGGTAEGASKNQIDFDLVVASQAVVKRTAYIKVSTEMLDDIAFIESEINNELMRELMKDVELTAYSGNGSAPNMNGVLTTATAFAAGSFALAVDNANEVDVLVVAMNQIAIANQEAPNYILMHPTDVTKLKLVKVSSTDKRYVERLAMIGGSLSLDGVPIIETTLVTAGTYLIGDFSKATLYTKDAVSIMMGLDGNDLTNNLRTIIAEYRGALVVKNNDRTAFVKGTFATDIAALETA